MPDRVKLTEAQWRQLEGGFIGPRPGSNALPLLQLGDGASRINGDVLDALWRDGKLSATPSQQEHQIKGGMAGPFGEIPDVELNFAWRLTSAGRALLASNAKGE
jgi:hypothetical protein